MYIYYLYRHKKAIGYMSLCNLNSITQIHERCDEMWSPYLPNYINFLLDIWKDFENCKQMLQLISDYRFYCLSKLSYEVVLRHLFIYLWIINKVYDYNIPVKIVLWQSIWLRCLQQEIA